MPSSSVEDLSRYWREGSRLNSKARDERSAWMMAAKVPEEVTRKVFIGRVRCRKVVKRWWANDTAVKPTVRPIAPPNRPPFTVAL